MRYLKLVGCETYGHPFFGIVKKGAILEIEDDAFADKLLEKGELREDETLKSWFVETSKPKSSAKPAPKDEESGEQGGDEKAEQTSEQPAAGTQRRARK